jgi:hypothetical protein
MTVMPADAALGEALVASVPGLRVPEPSIAEQLRVLACFARPKDHQHAELLRAL